MPIVFSVALVAANLVAFQARSHWDATPFTWSTGKERDPLVVARSMGDDQVVIGTRTNDLVVLTADTEVARTPFDGSLRDIAVGDDWIAAGGSLGQVRVFDRDLQPAGEVAVPGQVTAIATFGNAAMVVSSPGGYANRSTFTTIDPGAGTINASYEFDINVTAIAIHDAIAVYGTLNSRVRRFDAQSGAELWSATLADPVTSITIPADGETIAVGTDKGGITLLDPTGGVIREMQAGTSPIRALSREGERWLAGDARGVVYGFDRNGVVEFVQQVADRDIALIDVRPTQPALIVPRDGAWAEFDASALTDSARIQKLGVVTLWLNLVLGAGLIVSTLAQFHRVRDLTRYAVEQSWQSRLAYLFLLPALAFIVVFTYYPIVKAVYYSFTNFSVRQDTMWVGIRNYQQILTSDYYFRTGFGNMMILIAAGIVKTLTMPLLAAELVFWLRGHTHQYVYRTLFVLPAVVPDLVFALLWRQVYDPNTGLLNKLLGLVGLSQWQRGWLGDESTALWAIVWVGFPFISAFAFLIYLGGLLSINTDYFDAARIDGAGHWRRFRNLDVPLLIPQFRIMLFFAFSGAVQGFASIFILTRGGPGHATYVPALQMYFKIADGEFGYASAIGVVLFVMVAFATYFVLNFRRQTVEEV